MQRSLINMDNHKEKIINAENLNVDATLDSISAQLKSDQTLILDVGNNYFNQTDIIYDKLIMRGFDVRKTFRNGRNQIVVSNRKGNIGRS